MAPGFWPPYTDLAYRPVANPTLALRGNRADPRHANPSIVPESFMDTPWSTHGLPLPRRAAQRPIGFRILNCGQRPVLESVVVPGGSNNLMWNPDGTLNDPGAGEVPMVPALRTRRSIPGGTGRWHQMTWDKAGHIDGRLMGVPDRPIWARTGSRSALKAAFCRRRWCSPQSDRLSIQPAQHCRLDVTKHSLYLVRRNGRTSSLTFPSMRPDPHL